MQGQGQVIKSHSTDNLDHCEKRPNTMVNEALMALVGSSEVKIS